MQGFLAGGSPLSETTLLRLSALACVTTSLQANVIVSNDAMAGNIPEKYFRTFYTEISVAD